jgi:ATP-dependent helicase HepA
LANKVYYERLRSISRMAANILLLSATPVQQRKEEYLDLLRILQPQKYADYDAERFAELLGKQGKIIQKTALILDDLGDYEEAIGAALDSEEDPHESEDCKDLFDEICSGLEEICDELNDEKLSAIRDEIAFESDDLGVYKIKVVISYICNNYQIESNVIRNRRKILETSDDSPRLLPVRVLEDTAYVLDKDKNTYEAICYEVLSEWLTAAGQKPEIDLVVRPLLGTFFSSPWAFLAQLKALERAGVSLPDTLASNAGKWLEAEKHTLSIIKKVLDDPAAYDAQTLGNLPV